MSRSKVKRTWGYFTEPALSVVDIVVLSLIANVLQAVLS